MKKLIKKKKISNKDKKVWRALNCIEHSLIAISTITGSVSNPTFACLVGIVIGITNSTSGLEICVTTAGIKKCKSIIKKNNKKQDRIVLLAINIWIQ